MAAAAPQHEIGQLTKGLEKQASEPKLRVNVSEIAITLRGETVVCEEAPPSNTERTELQSALQRKAGTREEVEELCTKLKGLYFDSETESVMSVSSSQEARSQSLSGSSCSGRSSMYADEGAEMEDVVEEVATASSVAVENLPRGVSRAMKSGRVQYRAKAVGSSLGRWAKHLGWFSTPEEASARVERDFVRRTADYPLSKPEMGHLAIDSYQRELEEQDTQLEKQADVLKKQADDLARFSLGIQRERANSTKLLRKVERAEDCVRDCKRQCVQEMKDRDNTIAGLQRETHLLKDQQKEELIAAQSKFDKALQEAQLKVQDIVQTSLKEQEATNEAHVLRLQEEQSKALEAERVQSTSMKADYEKQLAALQAACPPAADVSSPYTFSFPTGVGLACWR